MVYYVGSILCAPSDLQHWGIKGQKWGLRRFRNPDGTLTDAGKARYAMSTGRKSATDMTNKELKEAVTRLENEKKWKSLIKELDGKKVSKGSERVGKLLSFVGNKIISPFTESAFKVAGKAFVESMTNDDSNDEQETKQTKKKKEQTNSANTNTNTNTYAYTTQDFGEPEYNPAPSLPSGKKKKRR